MIPDGFSKQGLTTLFSGVLSAERFLEWKVSDPAGAFTLGDYAFGEIFWRQSLGRSKTGALRDGINIRASHEQWLLKPIEGIPTWTRLLLPLSVSWWDGKDDGEFWRVPFLAGPIPSGVTNNPDPENFLYTHITPSINPSAEWTPRGRGGVFALAGYKSMQPPSADFVMMKGPVYLSFEIVLKPALVFNEAGLVIGQERGFQAG